jgi:SAM-dependent methyltransferase
MDDWKKIYAEKGIVQQKPSKQIVELIPFLNAENVVRVLDHGCGTGRHTLYLAQQGYQVVGTDSSLEAITLCKGLSKSNKNIFLEQAQMDSVHFPDNYFDAVISIQVIQHALKSVRDGAFREIYRTLNKNGLFFLRTISKRHGAYGLGEKIEEDTFINNPSLPDGATPHHYFSEEELRTYLFGYEIIRFEHNSFPPEKDAFWKLGLEEWAVLARKF